MNCKLYYFNSRGGTTEPIRLLLAYGGIEYEDIRAPINVIPAPLPEEIKSKCTWGQVPMLEIDGHTLCQSLSIARYLGKRFGLVPADDLEAQRCDEYVDTCRDMLNKWWTIWKPNDEPFDEAKKKEVYDETKQKYLNKFEEILKQNGNGKIVGKDLTWADIFIVHTIDNIQRIFETTLLDEDYPMLKQQNKEVFGIPSIKAWIEKRPQTKY